MTNEEILDLYWKRDESAVIETKAKYGRKIYQMAMGIVNNFQDAEECENDTYLNAWNSIPPHRPQYFFAYLLRIARNEALRRYNYNHAQKRGGVASELYDDVSYGSSLENQIDAHFDYQELVKALNKFLKKLDPEKQSVLVRKYWGGQKISYIAKTLNISESKVKMILQRTRKKLKEYLNKEGIHV